MSLKKFNSGNEPKETNFKTDEALKLIDPLY